MHVLIVGAGISGLTVAAGLVRAGIRVTVVEKRRTPGGLGASFVRNGYIYDLGPHLFFGKKVIPELKDFFDVEEVILEKGDLKQAIYMRGKMYGYPFQLGEILLKMDKMRLPRVFWEIALSRLSAGGPSATLEQWVKARVGRSLYEFIELEIYLQKLYGLAPADVSSDWGKHRLKPIANLSLLRILQRFFLSSAKGKKRAIYYCPEGIGQIADRLAAYVTEHGGDLIFDAEVRGLNLNGAAVTGVAARDRGGTRSLDADFVVSTLRMTDVAEMLGGRSDSAAITAFDTLRYRNVIFLYLVIDRPRVFKNCCVYFSTPDTIFKRVTEFKHFSSAMAPAERTSLCLEICVNTEDRMWTASGKELLDTVVPELESLGFIGRQEVVDHFVLKVPAVYPVYFRGYEEHLEAALRYLSGFRNLVSIGRRGLYQHDNMPTAIREGLDTAALLSESEGGDVDEVGRLVYRRRLERYKTAVGAHLP